MERSERSNHRTRKRGGAEHTEVSRGHSSREVKDRINRSPNLAKSKRASERHLETSTTYREEKLKLKVNKDKSRAVSVFAIRNFKYLGFALGRNGRGIFVRVHPKSWKKFKARLKELSSRRSVQSIRPSLAKITEYARGWLNYYRIADMKNPVDDINSWLKKIKPVG